jgi:hypothetical protein
MKIGPSRSEPRGLCSRIVRERTTLASIWRQKLRRGLHEIPGHFEPLKAALILSRSDFATVL